MTKFIFFKKNVNLPKSNPKNKYNTITYAVKP